MVEVSGKEEGGPGEAGGRVAGAGGKEGGWWLTGVPDACLSSYSCMGVCIEW